jgi:hypothetical protein
MVAPLTGSMSAVGTGHRIEFDRPRPSQAVYQLDKLEVDITDDRCLGRIERSPGDTVERDQPLELEVCTEVCTRRSSPTRLSQLNHSTKPNRLDLVT